MSASNRISSVALAALMAAPVAAVAAFDVATVSLPWEQTAPARSFTVFMERDVTGWPWRLVSVLVAVLVKPGTPSTST